MAKKDDKGPKDSDLGNTQVDFSLLSETEKDALRKKAIETARENSQERAADAFYEAELAKAEAEEESRQGTLEGQKLYEHQIDLAPSADHIRINGRIYQHGAYYKLTKDVLDVIRDIEFQGWKQEAVRKGDQENAFGLRSRNKILSARGVVRA